MRKTLVLEPALTLAWHEATAACCRARGLVVDVGGNFGWYTLFSLALGCDVIVFEPVPAWHQIMRLGVSLNPGFARRLHVYGNVVYNQPGNYTLHVPRPQRGALLGMTGMVGSAGLLKGYAAGRRAETVQAAAVRLDDVVQRDLCLLKADVEGYEPQVCRTNASTSPHPKRARS